MELTSKQLLLINDALSDKMARIRRTSELSHSDKSRIIRDLITIKDNLNKQLPA